MADYTAESIPSESLKEMLDDNWQNYGGEVPKPEIVEVNIPDEYQYKYNFQAKDYIFIQTDVTGEEAVARDTYRYWDFKFNLMVHIYTSKSRQRLYDIKKEIRRIVIYKMHDSSNTGYQLVRYGNFVELPQESVKVWKGQVRISYESAGVSFSVE